MISASRGPSQSSFESFGDWSDIGKLVLQAAELAATAHMRPDAPHAVDNGAALETSQGENGWKTHDLWNVAIGRGSAG